MPNNRKATNSRLIQRVPIFDKPKGEKDRKVISHKLIQHKKYPL